MNQFGLVAFAAAFCIPAWGQWERILADAYGTHEPQSWYNDVITDTPPPHPLSYFISRQETLKKGRRLCERLAEDEGRDSASNRSYKFFAKASPLGRAAGFQVLEISDYCAAGGKLGDVKGKSILVRSSKDAYREIYRLEVFAPRLALEPAWFAGSGSQRILGTLDGTGGSGGYCWESYWWFNSAGPHRIDFSRLLDAISAQMPEKTHNFFDVCIAPNFAAGEITSWVQKEDSQCRACDYVGKITARFRLNGWVAEPVELIFKPGSPNGQ